MTKNVTSICEYLNDKKISYRIIKHPPVYTAEQADKYVQKYRFARTKNLFLKNKKLIGCHPNDNTATVILGVKDLLQIIKQNGNPVKLVQL